MLVFPNAFAKGSCLWTGELCLVPVAFAVRKCGKLEFPGMTLAKQRSIAWQRSTPKKSRACKPASAWTHWQEWQSPTKSRWLHTCPFLVQLIVVCLRSCPLLRAPALVFALDFLWVCINFLWISSLGPLPKPSAPAPASQGRPRRSRLSAYLLDEQSDWQGHFFRHSCFHEYSWTADPRGQWFGFAVGIPACWSFVWAPSCYWLWWLGACWRGLSPLWFLHRWGAFEIAFVSWAWIWTSWHSWGPVGFRVAASLRVRPVLSSGTPGFSCLFCRCLWNVRLTHHTSQLSLSVPLPSIGLFFGPNPSVWLPSVISGKLLRTPQSGEWPDLWEFCFVGWDCYLLCWGWSSCPSVAAMERKQLKFAVRGTPSIVVLSLPVNIIAGADDDDLVEVFCIPIAHRKGGFILAIPHSIIRDEWSFGGRKLCNSWGCLGWPKQGDVFRSLRSRR